jgi:hypothetical protein
MTKGWLSFARTCPEQIAEKRQIDVFGNVEQEQRPKATAEQFTVIPLSPAQSADTPIGGR